MILLGMASIVIFNYSIDSFGLFHDKGILNAAKDLAGGKFIAGLTTRDDRALNKFIIDFKKEKIDAIAIGSSRIMLLRKNFVGGDSFIFFNHVMSICRLGDYISIVGMYKTKGYLPRKVILGIDPWIFNKSMGYLDARTEVDSFKLILDEIKGSNKQDKGVPFTGMNKYLQLINLEYTKNNIEHLLKKDKRFYYVADNINIDDNIIAADGSYYVPLKIRSRTKTEQQLPDIANAAAYLADFHALSHQDLFESFVDYLTRNHIDVVFYLAPYHPHGYRYLMGHEAYRIIDDVEHYLKDVSERKNVKLLGSYNPAKYGFQEKDFYDFMHGHEVVVKTIFEKEFID